MQQKQAEKELAGTNITVKREDYKNKKAYLVRSEFWHSGQSVLLNFKAQKSATTNHEHIPIIKI